MRARPEPTQLEHLSDASSLGKLLVFPPNVRLDWKVIASYKHSSLLWKVVTYDRKKFYNIDTWIRRYKPVFLRRRRSGNFGLKAQFYSTFYGCNLRVFAVSLNFCTLTGLSSQV